MHDLEPGDVAQEHQGQEGGAERRRADHGGPEPLPRAAPDELRAEGLPLVPLEGLAGADHGFVPMVGTAVTEVGRYFALVHSLDVRARLT